MGEFIRAGVVGTGAWGRNHARVYSELQNVELVGVCDMRKDAADAIALKHGTRAFYDVDEFLAQDELDMISICTPTTTHFEIGIKAVENGKHVLVEKPVTTTVKEAIELTGAARKKGVKLTVGFIERFNPIVQTIKELKEDGELGAFVSMSTRRIGPFWPERVWDIGVVKDSAIHDVDALRHIAGGSPKAIFAVGGSLKHKYEDYVYAVLDFGNNVKGTIEANFLTPHKLRKISVTAENGVIDGDYMSQELVVETKRWLKHSKNEWQEPLRAELSAFVEAIREDKPPIVSGEDGIEVLKICEAILESIRTGEVVRF